MIARSNTDKNFKFAALACCRPHGRSANGCQLLAAAAKYAEYLTVLRIHHADDEIGLCLTVAATNNSPVRNWLVTRKRH